VTIIFYLSVILGLIASGVQIIGYIIYSKKISIGRIRPNTASWSIWAFGAVLESYSYIALTNDWVKNILPAACAVSVVWLFVFCVRRGHFDKPTKFEIVIVLMDCAAILVWWVYGSALYANLLLILMAIVSFVPLMIGVWFNPTIEDALPWYLWSVAYAVLVIVVILRWEKWEDLIYPIVFFVLHLIVGILSTDTRIAGRLKPLNTKH